MGIRGHRRAACGGLLLAFALFCIGFSRGEAAESIASPGPDDADEPEEVVYAARTRPDRVGRIMAPVFVNGQGPFSFIVDTGATRSAIAPHLAERLGLLPDFSQPLDLHGITGAASVPSILVQTLQVGDLTQVNRRLPVVVPTVFADADGILGVDGFKNMCLRANFVDGSVSITRKGCTNSSKYWPRANARFRFGGLVVVAARVGGQRVKAIIDTGAERSLGNPQLLRALGLEDEAASPMAASDVTGATEHRMAGSTVLVPTIFIDELEVTTLPVTFGDFAVFRLWNLDTEPAVVLGMDVLGTIDGLVIDYRRSQIRVLPAGSSGEPEINQRALPGRLP